MIRGQKKRLEADPRALAISGAENGIRTRDPWLGKPMLYQLSYFRFFRRLSLYTPCPRIASHKWPYQKSSP